MSFYDQNFNLWAIVVDSRHSMLKAREKELGKYGEVKHYPIGHFDIYIGDNFEKALGDQLEFFKKHLLLRHL